MSNAQRQKYTSQSKHVIIDNRKESPWSDNID